MNQTITVRGRLALLEDLVKHAVEAFQLPDDAAFKTALLAARSAIVAISEDAGVKLDA